MEVKIKTKLDEESLKIVQVQIGDIIQQIEKLETMTNDLVSKIKKIKISITDCQVDSPT